MGLKELFQSSAVVLKKDYFQGMFVVHISRLCTGGFVACLTRAYQCEVGSHNTLFLSSDYYKELKLQENLAERRAKVLSVVTSSCTM